MKSTLCNNIMFSERLKVPQAFKYKIDLCENDSGSIQVFH